MSAPMAVGCSRAAHPSVMSRTHGILGRTLRAGATMPLHGLTAFSSHCSASDVVRVATTVRRRPGSVLLGHPGAPRQPGTHAELVNAALDRCIALCVSSGPHVDAYLSYRAVYPDGCRPALQGSTSDLSRPASTRRATASGSLPWHASVTAGRPQGGRDPLLDASGRAMRPAPRRPTKGGVERHTAQKSP